MAPTEDTFPVSELESQVHNVKKNFKNKSRKLPRDFDLTKDCELFEVVQYSSTTEKEIRDAVLRNPNAVTPREFFPFVRLFRRCGSGANVFHVETTAWEGEYAWQSKKILKEKITPVAEEKERPSSGGWLWFKS